jgi:glycosyltransferase involved in cell wall biosynthesis
VADVFVLPTLEDNWSLVIPEAMACGLPVTTSIYNGCHAELIRDGENGCTFDTYNTESLLQALAYFHGKNLAAMGRCSMELEKYFDTEHCTQRVYEVLKQL